MSASTLTNRSRRRAMPTKKLPEDPIPEKRHWIGVDFAQFGTSRPSRALLPLLILALLVALGIAALRIDLIRTRYALAAAMAEEKELIATQHTLIVQRLQLRDPVGLAVLARERGFRSAETTRTLVDPMPMAASMSRSLRSATSPPVSAGPPETVPSFRDANGQQAAAL